MRGQFLFLESPTSKRFVNLDEVRWVEITYNQPADDKTDLRVVRFIFRLIDGSTLVHEERNGGSAKSIFQQLLLKGTVP